MHMLNKIPYLICHEPLQSLGNRKKEGEEREERSVKCQETSQTADGLGKKRRENKFKESRLLHTN